ncbi:MAG: ATP-dependent DNA helicase RecG [Flavobacteriales bacterium]
MTHTFSDVLHKYILACTSAIRANKLLHNDITYLKGVGPARGELFKKELGIYTWSDLLEHFPFRYIDRSQIVQVKDVQSDAVHVQMMGTIVRLQEIGEANKKRMVATFRDETGEIKLVWFTALRWLRESIKLNEPYVIFGKPQEFKGKYNIPHPEMELMEEARITQGNGLKPVYSTTEKCVRSGLNSNAIAKLTRSIADEAQAFITENLTTEIVERFKLMPRSEAIFQIHMPADTAQLEAARRRLKFEELFFIQLQLGKQKLSNTRLTQGVVFSKVGELFNDFYYHHLPFELTGAQKRVVKEIRADVARGGHMNRLIQGDVGSGKTIVAVMCALLAMDNGYQICMMVPTEILAQQHLQSITTLLAKVNVPVALLTGTVKGAQRKRMMNALVQGEIKFVLGTHALIEDKVQFQNLGLCIIDEQHRFGVAQRAALWKKATLPPHVLVMTATPIPRTLAMTLYGDLDISVIDELPPGRKPIKTIIRGDSKRLEVFGFMEKEIEQGRQIYVVYPLIEESETLDLKDLTDGYESIVRRFPLPQYRVGIVHGKMKSEAREFEMQQFVAGNTHIMVATTVIEVGVNVPNASVMIIESAERFGLSQLHQLRGRVGRGADQSYCILMPGHKQSSDSRIRLQTMADTNDGFKIAEVDLQLRGPGDLGGTQQSGVLNLKIADLARDQQMLSTARELALEILDEDPNLMLEKNKPLALQLHVTKKAKSDWSEIS